MKTFFLSCVLFLSFLSLPAFPQGSLTPPGAPAPTMKSLDQIEPRKAINAINTPGDATSVFKITAPGSYYLTSDVAGVSGKSGISVAASNVTIDLMGFALKGASGSLDGVHVETGNSKLAVRDGTIAGWTEDGIDEVDADSHDGVYENIRATGNNGDGLRLDEGCVVTACNLEENGGYGVSVNGRGTFRNCRASANNLSGFYFGGGLIENCVASASKSQSGVEVFDEPVLIKNCVAFGNSGAGLRAGAGAKFSDCISRQNSLGIDLGYFSTITNCMVKNNGLGIYGGGSNHIAGNMCEGNGDGIYVYENRNVIDGNQVLNGGTGIKIQTLFKGGGVRNLVIRNMVGNNSTNFDIVEGNRYGPIVDITTGATPSVSGDSAADTTTTTHPWANLTYAQEPP